MFELSTALQNTYPELIRPHVLKKRLVESGLQTSEDVRNISIDFLIKIFFKTLSPKPQRGIFRNNTKNIKSSNTDNINKSLFATGNTNTGISEMEKLMQRSKKQNVMKRNTELCSNKESAIPAKLLKLKSNSIHEKSRLGNSNDSVKMKTKSVSKIKLKRKSIALIETEPLNKK